MTISAGSGCFQACLALPHKATVMPVCVSAHTQTLRPPHRGRGSPGVPWGHALPQRLHASPLRAHPAHVPTPKRRPRLRRRGKVPGRRLLGLIIRSQAAQHLIMMPTTVAYAVWRREGRAGQIDQRAVAVAQPLECSRMQCMQRLQPPVSATADRGRVHACDRRCYTQMPTQLHHAPLRAALCHSTIGP